LFRVVIKIGISKCVESLVCKAIVEIAWT